MARGRSASSRITALRALPFLMLPLAATGCQEPPPEIPAVVEIPAPAEPRPAATRIHLGRGGTLDEALDRLGVPAESRPRVLEALRPWIDPRRLSPASGLAVLRHPGGAIASVSCRPEVEHFVRVSLDATGVARAERVPVPVRASVSAAGGVVETTVAGALSGLHDAPELTARYADIFQWDVDLFTDPRRGDVVRLVYETRSLDRPEPDLPPFGDTGLEEGAFLGIGRVLAASYEGQVADSTAFWVEENGSSGGYYDQRGRSLRKAFLRSPLNFRRISSRFSHARRHPITRRVVPHHGVDFAADWGTPVVAAADGRVISAAWDGALGRAVRIRHANGWRTIYGHLRGYARGIRPGARVEQNQVIGYVGATGRATGPHLHYTMQRDGVAINPLTFDNVPAEPLAEAFRPNLERALAAWSPVLASVRPEGGRGSVAEAVGPPPRERTGG